jgi:hypothetical protein
LDENFASRYAVQTTARRRTLRSVSGGSGGNDALALLEAESRYRGCRCKTGPAGTTVEVGDQGSDFGESANAFIEVVARNSPRGYFPRGFSGEQAYWTLVGIDGGSDSALLSTDGALEAGQGGFSIEPFVVARGKLTTWAEADPRPFLPEGYLPMPGVRWRQPQWELSVSSFASGARGSSWLVARYEITNMTGGRLPLELVLGIRPFQATRQRAPVTGSAIRDIVWDGMAFTVNDQRKVYALQRPDKIGAFSSDPAALPKLLARSAWAEANRAHDAFGYASGALGYKLDLPPHGSRTIDLLVPLSGSAARPDLRRISAGAWVARQQRSAAAAWREKLNRVSLKVPPAAQPLVDAVRTSLAHILMTRDGPMLRPGTRSYARSWIRDGAMIAESLLRLGDAGVGRVSALVRAASIRQRQDPVLCRPARRRPGPGKRQRRRIHLSRCRDLSLHARSRADRGDVAARAGGRALPRHLAALRAHRCQSRAGQAHLLRSAAGIDQPRGVFGKADAFVLGRLLGIEGIRRRDRYCHRAQPQRGSGPPPRRARYLSP